MLAVLLVSEGCLEVVGRLLGRMSGGCREGVGKVSEVHGGCLEGVQRVSRWCLDGIYGMFK